MRDSRKPARSTGRKWLSAGLILTLLIAAFVTLIGSGGSSGDSNVTGGGSNTGINMVSAPLGVAFKNILIAPNTETEVTFTYTIPDDVLTDSITSYDGFMVDLDETMKSVSVTSNPIAMNESFLQKMERYAWQGIINLVGIEKAMAAVNATVNVFVSYPGDTNVCASATRFGPYTFSGDVDIEPTSESPTATTANAPASIDVISTGTFEMCVVISPLAIPASVYLTIDEVALETIPCEEAPVSDGTVLDGWSGDYSCTNFGIPHEGGKVFLTISKNNDGSYSYIDDGGAMYDGHFCGNAFKFSGGLPGDYTESGTFVLGENGVATKTSVWNSISPGIMGGNCFDDLIKD